MASRSCHRSGSGVRFGHDNSNDMVSHQPCQLSRDFAQLTINFSRRFQLQGPQEMPSRVNNRVDSNKIANLSDFLFVHRPHASLWRRADLDRPDLQITGISVPTGSFGPGPSNHLESISLLLCGTNTGVKHVCLPTKTDRLGICSAPVQADF